MSVCIVRQDGEIGLHKHMQAAPAPFLQAIAPSRAGLVVAVAGLFTWYWRADLCAQQGLPFVLGHALSLKALHGGTAKHDTMDAPKIAVLLRGGLLPQAYVSPADLRATRDLLRRRLHLLRQRAEWLGPIQQTTSPYHLPDMGQKIASKANRDGVAERFAHPAVQKRLAVDLALMGPSDHLRRARALAIVKTAQPHDAHTLSLRRTGPGIGESLSLVLLEELHDLQRVPRGPDFVSSCRLVQCAKASAGQRYGTSGTQSGTADRKWAFSEAAVLFLRPHPPGQN